MKRNELKALQAELQTVESQARAAFELHHSLLQTDNPDRHRAKAIWDKLLVRANTLQSQIDKVLRRPHAKSDAIAAK